jgi:quercetin dioxygenase-like cupin family protein
MPENEGKNSQEIEDKSVVVLPGEGKAPYASEYPTVVRLGGADTAGVCSVVEITLPSGASPAPLQANMRADQLKYVQEGVISFELGERYIKAPAGTLIYIPRGSACALWNAEEEPARYLSIYMPAGHENIYDDIADIIAADHVEGSKVRALYAKYGIEVKQTLPPYLRE